MCGIGLVAANQASKIRHQPEQVVKLLAAELGK
jgi:hypothetical protein